MNPASGSSRCADLHLHTCYSDGSYTPAGLVQEAVRQKFAAIAVTDHDTLDAVPEMLSAGETCGLEIIPGVEITCRLDSHELHMLGYFPNGSWENANLRAVLDHSQRVREQRTHQFVAKLNELGVPVTVDDVAACSNGGTMGRPHVAMALQRRGIVTSVDEAFDRFLKRGRPAYVERYRMSVAEAIAHIKRAGGAAVLAHPGLNRVDERVREMVHQGLDGLEVWHSRHSPAQIQHYLRLAEQLGLLATGGSDCHGAVRGDALLGTVKLPYERVEALKLRARVAT
jgi:predicted metal-dependent phosphoesterase TrpH